MKFIRHLLLATGVGLLAVPMAWAQGTIRIGYTEVLSGTFAQIGDQGIKSMQFAIDQVNARGGVLGKKLELVAYDNKGQPSEALIMLQKMVDDNLSIVMNCGPSNIGAALIPAVEKHNAREPGRRGVCVNCGALAPEQGFYQRILAGDPDEAAYQAEEFLKSKPLSAYYDEVAIRGLALAQLDMNRDGLEHERRVQIKEAVDGIIDDLSDHDDVAPLAAESEGTVLESPTGATDDIPLAWRENAVLCVAGRGSLDEASAAMLAQLLGKHGIGARIVPRQAASASAIFRLDVTGVEMAVLCYL